MIELLVPPLPGQEGPGYDTDVRPALLVRSIDLFREAGITADLWKIEGLERPEDCARVVRSAIAPCVVLGRGADRTAVERWLRAAAAVEGFAGFAIGRSIWWDALRELPWDDRDAVTASIADAYASYVISGATRSPRRAEPLLASADAPPAGPPRCPDPRALPVLRVRHRVVLPVLLAVPAGVPRARRGADRDGAAGRRRPARDREPDLGTPGRHAPGPAHGPAARARRVGARGAVAERGRRPVDGGAGRGDPFALPDRAGVEPGRDHAGAPGGGRDADLRAGPHVGERHLWAGVPAVRGGPRVVGDGLGDAAVRGERGAGAPVVDDGAPRPRPQARGERAVRGRRAGVQGGAAVMGLPRRGLPRLDRVQRGVELHRAADRRRRRRSAADRAGRRARRRDRDADHVGVLPAADAVGPSEGLRAGLPRVRDRVPALGLGRGPDHAVVAHRPRGHRVQPALHDGGRRDRTARARTPVFEREQHHRDRGVRDRADPRRVRRRPGLPVARLGHDVHPGVGPGGIGRGGGLVRALDAGPARTRSRPSRWSCRPRPARSPSDGRAGGARGGAVPGARRAPASVRSATGGPATRPSSRRGTGRSGSSSRRARRTLPSGSAPKPPCSPDSCTSSQRRSRARGAAR